MDNRAIKGVVNCWIDQYRELGAVEYINYVQIFENRGDIMGCSNPHPHGQIWSNETIPYLPALEQSHQHAHLEKNGTCLLCDYLKSEMQKKERIVIENDSFVALVPFWAVWPYEIMVLPRKHHGDMTSLSEKEKEDLSDILRRICIRYDNLFSTFFPYSMGIHQKPTDGQAHDEWHFHFHFYPPLLRSATVKKFMVGYEMLASPQRDITAENSAEKLRECSEIHFLKK
jgi:UDPglucose--hexose-1-phosphate uridylyltransferase